MTCLAFTSHPELVSPRGDCVPGSYFATLKIKMLKQVQHDDVCVGEVAL